jgi:hypothetical protein
VLNFFGADMLQVVVDASSLNFGSFVLPLFAHDM